MTESWRTRTTGTDYVNQPALSTSMRYLASALRRSPAQSIFISVLLLLNVVPQLLTPEIFRRIIDSSTSAAPTPSAWRLVAWYFLLAVVGQGVTLSLTYLTTRLTATATARMRDELVEHTLHQGPSFFRRFVLGELVERIDGDTGRLGATVSDVLIDITAQLLLAVGVIAALFHLDWRFGLLFTPFAVTMAALLNRQTGRALPHVAAERQIQATVVGFIDERLGGADDIRTNGAADAVRESLWSLLRLEYEKARRAAGVASRWPATIQALSSLSVLAALALGGWLHNAGYVTVGTVFAALSYATLIRFPLAQLANRIQDVEHAAVSLHRLDELRRARSHLQDGSTKLPARTAADIVFDGVAFSYEDGPEVLSGLSFQLPAGQKMAVLGRTGSGKSTILGLVFRRFDPVAGTIRIGGHDILRLNRRGLRERIAYIPQRSQVLAASVRDNVTLFDDQVEDARVEEALRRVGLGPWLDQLPTGLQTVLEAPGTGLSLGQAQLLSLARALIVDPELVLLDEPTGTLDPHTERLLRQGISRFLHGRTAIIVSHSLDILHDVDWVLLLDDGRVIEFGERGTLLADPASEVSRLIVAGRLPQ